MSRCRSKPPIRPPIGAYLDIFAKPWSRRPATIELPLLGGFVASRRLDPRRIAQPQLADRGVLQDMLADLAGHGPRQALHDHDVLRDLEMSDLTLAVLLEIVR